MDQYIGGWVTYVQVSSTGLHSLGYLRYPLKAGTYNMACALQDIQAGYPMNPKVASAAYI